MYIDFISPQKRNELISIRNGEQKIGECIHFADEALWDQSIEYVIFGVPEDIGVRANFGKKGTSKAFEAFLSSFLNMQANQYVNIDNVLILGSLHIEDLHTEIDENNNMESLRNAVEIIDSRLSEVVSFIH